MSASTAPCVATATARGALRRSRAPAWLALFVLCVGCAGSSGAEQARPPLVATSGAATPQAGVPSPLGLNGDEGMWLFEAFPSDRVRSLHGAVLSQSWLDHVRLSSVRLSSGCSGSFVSARGLVLTAQHCIQECLRSVSTKQSDLVEAGYFAATDKDEKKCPDLELDVLVDARDVTHQVAEATKGAAENARESARRAALNQLQTACAASSRAQCEVVTLYSGERYHLYTYRRYTDVRLVFAPELATGFFGGFFDNFHFPRYELDAAFLRAYDSGKPADVEHHLRWSRRAPVPGEPTFVSGNPSYSLRDRTVAQLVYQRDAVLPEWLIRLSEERGILTQFASRGAKQAAVSKERLMDVENSIKALRGERLALTDGDLVARAAKEEELVRARVAASPELAKIAGRSWDEIEAARRLARSIGPRFLMLEHDYLGPILRSRLFEQARAIVRFVDESAKPDSERLREYSESQLGAIKGRLLGTQSYDADFETVMLTHGLEKLREALGPDDPAVRHALGQRVPAELAAEVVRGTKVGDAAFRRTLLEGGQAELQKTRDPLIALAVRMDGDARSVRRDFEERVQAVERRAGQAINRARFALFGASRPPEATFTLRLSFGAVAGWNDRGATVPPLTTFGGAFAHATGVDPFRLPKSWIAAKGALDHEVPLNMAMTNDATAGNSGSPVVDAKGEVIGVYFDGNLPSLGGIYAYDSAANRSVAVTSAAIQHALEKIYGATRIVDELQK